MSFERRLEAQRAIEQVYWNHRIWPKENPDPKPALSAVLSEQELRARVTAYLDQSVALERTWGRPITHADLQAEMNRMAASSRAPVVLRDLFTALDDDAELIAETLVRGSLAERRLREIHELEVAKARPNEQSFDAWAAESAPNDSPELPLSDEPYQLATIGSDPKDMWTPTSLTNVPSARVGHTAVWTGVEMIIWGGPVSPPVKDGGRYYPATDTWLPTSVGTNCPSARFGHTAIWNGLEMIVWGGWAGNGPAMNDGGRYNPASDAWVPMPMGTNVPTGRFLHTAVWTGTQMIVWGGSGVPADLNSGARFTLATNSWAPTSVAGSVPSIRSGHTAVWTGSRMVIWGGASSGVNQNTGGRYDPSTDTWSPTSTGLNVPNYRTLHTAVWTGTRMLVWGGTDNGNLNSGGGYDPEADSWTVISTGTNVPTARNRHTAVWTGTEMIVWGGNTNTGGRYDPAVDQWTPTTTQGSVPSSRRNHSAVWTGTEMIVWGGQPIVGSLNTGGHYGCPTSDIVYRDADGDGYGDVSTVLGRCDFGGAPPAGYVSLGGDCNDADASIHPAAPDLVCNGIDDDCNGVRDNGTACVCIENSPGLVGWWRGNGNTSDEISSENGGIPVGGLGYAAGNVGQAFQFDGVDDHVGGLGDAFTYAFMENTGVFSIDAWIEIADIAAPIQLPITSNAETSLEKGHFFTWENGTGQRKLRLGLTKAINGSPIIDSSSPNHVITTPGWHHVAVVGNGTNITFYVDGVAYAGTGTMTAKPAGPSTRSPWIGAGPGGFFHGKIDELQYYDRALTAAQVEAIFDAGSTGMCGTGCAQAISGLVGWWPGNGDGNDRSPFRNHADAAFTGFAPGKVGQAFDLEGTDHVPTITDDSSLELDQLTLAAWIRPSGANTHQQIVSKFGTSGNLSYQFGLHPSGVLRADLSGDGVTYEFLLSPPNTILANTWSHVATTFESGNWKLYVNGVQVASKTTAFTEVNKNGSTLLNIGRDPIGNQYFTGLIDEPMVFARELRQEELEAIYEAGSSGMCGLGLVLDADPPANGGRELDFAAPWPNPTLRAVNLRFRLPAASEVRAEVFDLAGRLVVSLVDGERLAAGEHARTWNGTDPTGRRVAAGVYHVRISAGHDVSTRRVILMQP